MPRPMHAHRGLAQASRLEVAYLVMERPGISLAELSEETGLHANTLRDHVRVLIAEGIIRSETERRPTRGRPPAVYFPVRATTDNEMAQRRVDEAKRHGDLLRRIMASEAPELDEDAMHQLDALYEHLDELGLEPDLDEKNLEVALSPCRFHTLVAERGHAVCRVHEGLIRDVLDRAEGPLEVDRLLPLVTDHQCELLLRLRPADA